MPQEQSDSAIEPVITPSEDVSLNAVHRLIDAALEAIACASDGRVLDPRTNAYNTAVSMLEAVLEFEGDAADKVLDFYLERHHG